jgi:hypothetical protein
MLHHDFLWGLQINTKQFGSDIHAVDDARLGLFLESDPDPRGCGSEPPEGASRSVHRRRGKYHRRSATTYSVVYPMLSRRFQLLVERETETQWIWRRVLP